MRFEKTYDEPFRSLFLEIARRSIQPPIPACASADVRTHSIPMTAWTIGIYHLSLPGLIRPPAGLFVGSIAKPFDESGGVLMRLRDRLFVPVPPLEHPDPRPGSAKTRL